MIQLCIFDLDGTLLNSLQDLANAMNYALMQNGFPPHPAERYRQLVGDGVAVLADRAVGGAENYTPAVKEKLLSEFRTYYAAHCMDNTVPYDGIIPLLHDLKQRGILCTVNSNKPDDFTKKLVTALLPSELFAEIRGKREDCERKPSPMGTNAIMQQLGCTPEHTLYIGDSNVDARTAKNAHLTFCGVRWGFRSPEELLAEGAAHIASTPADILSYLLTL